MSSKPSTRESAAKNKTSSPTRASKEVLDRICGRAHYLTTQMIWLANNREKDKGDPKVGGHPAACASSLHITGALHLLVKSGFDYVANKPHAAPVDHSYNYLLKLFLNTGGHHGEPVEFLGQDLSRLSQEQMDQAMLGLRKFSENGEPVFQSYHSAYDSDHHGFLPSGTVGIPPVNVGYLAHAYRFAKDHGYNVPDAHFWAIIGDSEFREGSLHEAIPDFAERELGNLTWIVDYNRQSLDGHRITNKEIMNGTDDKRIERSMIANGWDVIQVQHGHKRLDLFKKPNGEAFKKLLEEELQDYEFQALLLVADGKALREGVLKTHPHLKAFLGGVNDAELHAAFRDLGGHDIVAMANAMLKSKENPRKPTMIVAHTLKGWGLEDAAAPGNHSSLPTQEEVDALRSKQELTFDKKGAGASGFAEGRYFEGFAAGTAEGEYLKTRGDEIYADIKAQYKLRDENWQSFQERMAKNGEIPVAMGISLKMAQYPHTQWMLGQLTAKLTRIANAPIAGETPKAEKTPAAAKKAEKTPAKELPADEMPWRVPAELFVTMAPDVGTSTNLNPAMDGKIFGAPVVTDVETDLGVKDKKLPDLVPGEDNSDRFIRFEIAEGNVMSCVGSYGKIREYLGIPILPLMTVYDFFVKRAHDQFFYNLYWKSSFICVGTPAGVTLSPEGAQHGWKSDFQIPNQITWEPFFCQELDWILSESIRRHMTGDNAGRTGVVIRGVTRGVEQKMFAQNLKRQLRFKTDRSQLLHATGFEMPGAVDEAQVESMTEEQMFEEVRHDVLAGAYYLVDYRGYAGYEPGDNVVNILAMGSLVTEALKASETLLRRGIYANVIVVTSSDLLLGEQAHTNDYSLLKERLNLNANLHLVPTAYTNGQGNGQGAPELAVVAGRRVPCVSVHDGEPGLLDNIGSAVGVRQEALAVRKHSKCGRPKDIFKYHHLDGDSIVDACGKVLADTALEQVEVSPHVLQALHGQTQEGKVDWRQLWPERPTDTH